MGYKFTCRVWDKGSSGGQSCIIRQRSSSDALGGKVNSNIAILL